MLVLLLIELHFSLMFSSTLSCFLFVLLARFAASINRKIATTRRTIVLRLLLVSSSSRRFLLRMSEVNAGPSTLSASTVGAAVGEPLKPIVGTTMARFLNQYNPYNSRPYERPTMNQNQILDPELTAALAAERASSKMAVHHRKKDWVKAYMDECVKFQNIMKGK